ncbi:MAG: NUDIX domain-containing protein [Phycisphaerales bacterium]|nr:NUDIX domain-containing protein [Phycisphaerales bacterium]
MGWSLAGQPPPVQRPDPEVPRVPARGTTIEAARDTYLRYAMQPHARWAEAPAENGVLTVTPSLIYHLAVTGVITAADPHGREHVLLGRRGAATFIYPGLWELAPGGGLESEDVWGQLVREMEEELEIPGLSERATELLEPPGPRDLLGLSIDPNTPSVDVVVRVRLTGGTGSIAAGLDAPAGGEHAWEYGSTRWVPVEELGVMAAAEYGSIIPPTLAIWQGLGWI